MRIDLHCHSTASDGTLSPAAVVALAGARGVDLLALTDHDTVSGIAEARAAARILQIRLLAGVEISALWAGREVHILGLGVNEADTDLREVLREQQNRRWARGREIATRLEDLGFEGAWGVTLKGAGNAVPGRAHFARFLAGAGGMRNIQVAFDHLLGPGRPAYVAPSWMDMESAVKCIAKAGGRAVLAHPDRYKFPRQTQGRLVGEFHAAGGWGMEVGDPRAQEHAPDMGEICAGLVPTWGSDFHCPGVGRELGMEIRAPRVFFEAGLF